MSKKVFMVVVWCALFALPACSGFALPQANSEVDDAERPDAIVSPVHSASASPNQSTSLSPTDSKEMPDNTPSLRPSGDADNTYTFTHEKNGETYTVSFTKDLDSYYTLQLVDIELNDLQSIFMDRFHGIEFMDVNLDEYTDLVINTGGTMNETYDLYIWNESSQNFTRVIYEGFEMLSFFKVYEGYIMNWVRDDLSSGIYQKLVWDGDTLVMESEEPYKADD